jgi:putative ABC transport system permease protein
LIPNPYENQIFRLQWWGLRTSPAFLFFLQRETAVTPNVRNSQMKHAHITFYAKLRKNMLRTRWIKVLRDLSSNKTRTILVILSIAVGVTALGMVMGAQSIVDESLPEQYAAINPASATLYTLDTFDDDLIEAIEAMPEVAQAEGRRDVLVRFFDKDGVARSIQLTAIPDYEDQGMNIIAPEEGAFPPPDRDILVERASLSPLLGLGDVKIGDTLVIEPPDGKKREVTIAGSVYDQSQLPAFMAGISYGYITNDTLEWLGEPRDYNQLVFVAADNKLDYEHIQTVSKLIQDRMERDGNQVVYSLIFPPGEHPAQSFLNAFSYILGAMGLLSLFLSGFLIVNILAAILAQQVRQIGIMKTVGARTGQITWMYFLLVLLFGVLGLMIAIPLGALGSLGLATLFSSLLNFNIDGFQLNPQVVLVQIVIGLSVPLLAAVYPVVKGVRITAREAMGEQGLGKGQFGSSWLDRVILGARKVFPIARPSQISIRNTFRRKGRLTLTLITLSLATTIFISIFTIRSSLQQTLDDALNFFDFDIQIVFDQAYRVEPLQQQVLNVPGVDGVETWGFGTARRVRPDDSESDSITVYAPEPDSNMLNVTLTNGRWLEEGDTNAIVINTDVLRNEDDIGVGDTITLNIDGKESDFEVVGIVRGLMTGANAFINFDYYGRVTNAVDKAQVVLVRLDDRSPQNQMELGQALEESYRRSGFRVQQMQTIAQLRTLIASIFNVIIVFLLFMALLLGIVGGLGLMGTMSINVIERTREIGVMRAIGASDGAVLRIVLLEGVIIGLISWIIGGLLALPASYFLTNTVGTILLQASPSYVFSISGTILWLFIVLVLAGIASFIPARSASKLTIREVLSYE